MKPGHYRYVPIEKIVWGADSADAVAAEAAALGARRVFTVASATLSRKTDAIARIRAALKDRDVGLFDACREHTPLESVIACAEAARGASPDLIVTVGGGTPIDTVKIVQLCLTQGIDSVETLLTFAGRLNAAPSAVRQVIVPTTLSGGEYSSVAGGTNSATKSKESFLGPDLCGRAIILDPAIVRHTPQWLWLSTGIRALDHAVEGYCAPGTNPMVQATALHAMQLLSSSLRATRQNGEDVDARHRSQMAVWLAATSLGRVSMGASHGIGYILGALCGVPHGYTSCVMLPAVLRWNEPVLGETGKEIARAMGMPGASAAEAVGTLIADLGLPRKLSDVGVKPEHLQTIAERAAVHPVVKMNVRPIRSADDTMEILKLAS